MFKLFVSEVLTRVSKEKTDEEKAKILRENSSIPLQQLLFANFNPKIKFLLPTTPTPYKPSKFDVGLGDNNLMKEFKKLYLFYQGGHPTLQQARREQLWIQLLEGLSSGEARVMESLKNKGFEKDYGVTIECVDLAFPKLLERVERPVKEEVKVEKTKKTKTTVKKEAKTSDDTEKKTSRPRKKKEVKKDEGETRTVV